jgi:hypothetical protein
MAGENQNGENQKSENERGGGLLSGIYRAVMRDGSLAALAREAIKDIQSSFHEFAWGQSEHAREPGAPLSPMPSDIVQAREQYAPRPDLPSPGDIIHGRNFTPAEQGQSYMRGQAQSNEQTQQSVQGATRGEQIAQIGPWTEREMEREQNRGGGGDQNELFRARILPDEQREQQEEIERGGRGR